MRQELNTTEATQGVTPHGGRWVLHIGTGLAIVALGLVWYFVS